MRLIPDRVQETVSVTKLPNFQEKSDISAVSYDNMRRYNDTINCQPVLQPVHFRDTLILFHNCTKKRFISHSFYEPKLKPRKFKETLVIYPKRPATVFVACIDYHIDECRKWFKTSVEFTAKTFTTNRIKKKHSDNAVCNGPVRPVENGEVPVKKELPVSQHASSVLIPRFDKPEVKIENHINGQILSNGDISLNGHERSGNLASSELFNDISVNGELNGVLASSDSVRNQHMINGWD